MQPDLVESCLSFIDDLLEHRHVDVFRLLEVRQRLKRLQNPAPLEKNDSLGRLTRQAINSLIEPPIMTFTREDLIRRRRSLEVTYSDLYYTPQIRQELQLAYDSCLYDCHRLDFVTEGNALAFLLFYFIEQEKLVDELSLDRLKCKNLAKAIQNAYLDIPFHNAVHGCAVLHSTIHLLRKSEVLMSISDAFQRAVVHLSACIAAAGHDMKHPGLQNQFLVMSDDPIAQTYNDQSVLENYHLSQLYTLFSADETNIFKKFARNIRHYSRKIISDMVLATDMQRHTDRLERFKNRMELNDQERLLITLQFILKCADISHSFLNFDLHSDWAFRLQQELFSQGDLEKSLSLPVSMFAERNNPSTTIWHNQTGFFRLIVLPMIRAMVEHFPVLQMYCDRAEANYRKWKEDQHEEKVNAVLFPHVDSRVVNRIT